MCGGCPILTPNLRAPMPDPSSSPNVHLPMEFLQQLRAMAAEGGGAAVAKALDTLPGMARLAPTIDVGQNVQMLALELGRLIANQESPKGQQVFVRDGAVVTVDKRTGKIEGLSAGRFVGWVEQFCAFRSSGRSNRLRDSLTREDAALILEQDVFKDCLRPLTAVHMLRLPVARVGEEWSVEFLEAGYDVATGIFTCDLLPYPMDWTVERARDWFIDVCGEVPWNGREEQPDLTQNRSLAVHVALTVGSYCHALFPPGTLRPMGAYFGNKPGTGKTRMAEMALAHVHNSVSLTTAPKDEEKMDVKLETIARAMRPFVIFDDIGGALRSNALNKFLTAPRHSGRCYNSNSEFFDVPAVTQVMVTANDLPTSEDLGRRALVAELFLAEEVRGRRFKRVISPAWLAEPSTRANFLAACCAIVKHWMNPTNDDRKMPRHSQPLETYEEWTGIVGAMVLLAGFADPLAQPEMDVGGATSEDEIKTLLIKIAESKTEDCMIARKELVETARAHGLIEKIVGTEGDPEPELDALKRLGRNLQRWRGQILRDGKGRRFQFSKKKLKTGASYPLIFLRSN